MDLNDLTDQELAEHLNAVLNEQERRARLARVPEQVAQMTAQYISDGGERSTLVEAVSMAKRDAEAESVPEVD